MHNPVDEHVGGRVRFRRTLLGVTQQQLAEALGAFRDAGIPTIVLKGAYVAEAVYKNIALRPMSDVDILVKKKDLPAVEKILLKLGYDPPEHPRMQNKTRYSRVPFHKLGGIGIEVHWIRRPDGRRLVDRSRDGARRRGGATGAGTPGCPGAAGHPAILEVPVESGRATGRCRGARPRGGS